MSVRIISFDLGGLILEGFANASWQFLDSVLSSIETGKPAPIPPATSRQPEPPVSSSTAKSEVRKPSSVSRDSASKSPAAGTKRKAEEQLRRPSKPNNPVPKKAVPSKPAPAAASKPRPNPAPGASKPTSSNNASTVQKPASAPAPAVSSKPPPPGSFADIMMKAKALQQNAPTQVGMFKHHQSTPKEKISKMERKKREMEAQSKAKDPRAAKKAGAAPGTAANAKPGDGKFAKKREPEELAYKGTGRPTQTPAVSEYRGTAGLPSKRGSSGDRQHSRAGRRSRADEYLGTDEEDEGDYADDYDDDDQYSDASSDMEAGFDNVEEEEAAALKAARREDEEELQAENAAKQEKLDRKKKLMSLASRAR